MTVLVLCAGCALAQADPGAEVRARIEKVIESARLLVRAGDNVGAHRIINAGISSGLVDPVLKKKRAQVLFLLRAYEPALRDLNEFIALEPRDGEAWLLLGGSLDVLNRPVAACKCYEEARRLGCEAPDLGRRLEASKARAEPLGAELARMREGAGDSGDNRYWWRRIELELMLGQVKEARASAEKWGKTSAGDPAQALAMGLARMEAEDWDGASSAIATASGEGAGKTRDTGFLEMAVRRGEWEKVVELAEQVRKWDKADERSLRYRAIGLLCLGRYEEYRTVLAEIASRAMVNRK